MSRVSDTHKRYILLVVVRKTPMVALNCPILSEGMLFLQGKNSPVIPSEDGGDVDPWIHEQHLWIPEEAIFRLLGNMRRLQLNRLS